MMKTTLGKRMLVLLLAVLVFGGQIASINAQAAMPLQVEPSVEILAPAGQPGKAAQKPENLHTYPLGASEISTLEKEAAQDIDWQGGSIAKAEVPAPTAFVQFTFIEVENLIDQGSEKTTALFLMEGRPVLENDLLEGASAKDENGNEVPFAVADLDGLNLGNPVPHKAEGYSIIYLAKHPVSGEVYTAKRAVFVLPKTLNDSLILAGDSAAAALTFTVEAGDNGQTTLYINEGTAITQEDLLGGVSAATEKGEQVPVVVKDFGGLNLQNPRAQAQHGAYTITYGAQHPNNAAVTAVTTRQVLVMAEEEISTFANENFRIDDGSTYENLYDAAFSVGAGGTVTMLKDVTVSETISLNLNKNYGIDLNGKTLKMADNNYLLSVLVGNVKIQNGNLVNTTGLYCIEAKGSAQVTLGNLSVRAEGARGVALGTTYEGKFFVLSGSYYGSKYAAYTSPYNGKITITGGHFTSSSDGDGYALHDEGTSQILLAGNSSANANPWKNSNKAKDVLVLPSAQNAYLGALSYAVGAGAPQPLPDFVMTKLDYRVELPFGTSNTAHITLTGTKAFDGAMIVENNGVTLENGLGTAKIKVNSQNNSVVKEYSVQFSIAPARFAIGSAQYDSLPDAIAAVQTGQTITMLEDVALGNVVFLNVDKNYILDLNGKTITNAGSDYLLAVTAGNATIQNGNLINATGLVCIEVKNVQATLANLNVRAQTMDGVAVLNTNSTLSILSGSYYGTKRALAVQASGIITITEGHFTASAADGFALYEGGADQIQLAGNSSANANPWKNSYEAKDVLVFPSAQNAYFGALSYAVGAGTPQPLPDFVMTKLDYQVELPFGTSNTARITLTGTKAFDGATIVENNGVTLENGLGTAKIKVNSQNNSVVKEYSVQFSIAPARFAIGSTRYGSLPDVMAAVQTGQTITMLEDVALGDVVFLNASKSYTLDLNGKTIINVGSDYLLVVSSGNVTIQNGNLINATGEVCIEVKNAQATLTNLNVRTEMKGSVAVLNTNSTLSILSGSYYGTRNAVFANGSGTITITEGHFTSSSDDGCALYEKSTNEIQLAASSSASANHWKNVYGAKDVFVFPSAQNAYLGSLSYAVDAGSPQSLPNFVMTKLDYRVELPPATSDTAHITLTGVRAFDEATIIENNGVTLEDGFGTAKIKVKSQNNNVVKEYSVQFSIKQGHYVCAMGNKKYTSLQDAMNDVRIGGTIFILEDLAFDSTVMLKVTGPSTQYTIDIGNNVLTDTRKYDGDAGILKSTGGEITIQNGSIISNYGNHCFFSENGMLTFSNVNFVSNGSSLDDSKAIKMRSGIIQIKSGFFKGNANYGLYPTQAFNRERFVQFSLSAGSYADVANLDTAHQATIYYSSSQNDMLTALNYSADGGPAAPIVAFDRSQNEYYCNLPATTSRRAKITLQPSKAVGEAIILANTGVTLVDGKGTAYVEVTSPDRHTIKRYTVHFNVDQERYETGGAKFTTLEQAVTAVQEGGTIKMLRDVETSKTTYMSSNKTYVLDMGAHKFTNLAQQALLNVTAGNVTIKNGSLTNTEGSCIIVSGGKVTLEKLKTRSENTKEASVSVVNGEVFIRSGSYYGANDAVCSAGGTVEFSGGRFMSSDSDADGCLYDKNTSIMKLAENASPSVVPWLKNRTVRDITILPESQNAGLGALSYTADDSAADLLPGFLCNKPVQDVLLPAGTSSTAVIALIPTPIAPTAKIIENKGVTLKNGVGKAKIVVEAQNGKAKMEFTINFTIEQAAFKTSGVYYTTLDEAVAAVLPGDTITMLRDVTLGEVICLNEYKEYTLDLGGKKLDTAVASELIKVDSGRVTIQNGNLTNKLGSACVVNDGGTLQLKDLVVSSEKAGDNVFAVISTAGSTRIVSGSYFSTAIPVCSQAGDITIVAGRFKSTLYTANGAINKYNSGRLALEAGSHASVYPWAENPAAHDVTITAGANTNACLGSLSYSVDGATAVSLAGFQPSTYVYYVVLPQGTSATASITLGARTSEPAANIAQNSGVTLSEGAGAATIKTLAGDGLASRLYVVNFIVSAGNFETGGNHYETLQEAIAAVQVDGTISMLRDSVVEDTVVFARNKPYTLDLKGCCLNYTGIGNIMDIVKGNVTIKNGTLLCPKGNGIRVDGGQAQLENMTITARKLGGFAVRVISGKAYIASGRYEGTEDAVYCGGNGDVTLAGGEYVGSVDAKKDGCLTGGAVQMRLALGTTASIDPWKNNRYALQVNIQPAEMLQLITIAPTHAMLSQPADEVEFTATIDFDAAKADKIVWSVSDAAAVIIPQADNKSVKVKAVDFTSAKTVVVTAVYDGKFTATATVEILPGAIVVTNPPAQGDTAVALLEKSATINTAKTRGALVPVLITNQLLPSISQQGRGLSPQPEPTMAVAPVVGSVVLEVMDKTGAYVPANFTGNLFAQDDRYIEIKANPGAKSTKKVRVSVVPAGRTSAVVAGFIDLTVVKKYPTIKVTVEPLNLFYPNNSAKVTAVSSDGACTNVALTFPPAVGSITYDAATSAVRLGTNPKTGNYSAVATLDVEGYIPNPYVKPPKVSVKVVNIAPKLKLEASTVTLCGTQDVAIALLSADKQRSLESYGFIEKITLDNGRTNLYENGSLMLPGNTPAGSHMVKVYFVSASAPVNLKLAVKVAAYDKLTISSAAKAITVNTNHQIGLIQEVDIKPSAANVQCYDWQVTKGTLPQGIEMQASINKVSFRVFAQPLETTKKPVVVEINSASQPFKKPLKLSISITSKATVASITLKGRLDVSNPKSELLATLKLGNTSSEIADASLDNAALQLCNIQGNTFKIRILPGMRLTPKVKHTVKVRLILKNGEVIYKNLNITPVQTVARVTTDKKAITLYKLAPLTGEAVGFKLDTPANASMGTVRINEASHNALKFSTGGFKLVQNGKNSYVLQFKEGKAPTVIHPRTGNSVPLKASYTLKLEVWAEGTYETNADGSFKEPLKDSKGFAKTAPRMVSIKIFVK